MDTYSTETKARKEASVEETIGKKCYSWNCVYNSKYIVQLKCAFSWFMV